MKKSVFYSHLTNASKQQDLPIEKILEFIRSKNFTGVEVDWWELKDSPDEFCKRLENADIKIANVCRMCDFINDSYKDDLQRYFETLSKYNCKKGMLIPGFFIEGNDRESDLKHMLDGLMWSCEVAKKYGITVSLEDFDHALSACNMNGIKYFTDNIQNIYHTLDTGNYFFFGENVLDAIKLLKDKIVHVHLKDRSLVPLSDNDEFGTTLNGTKMYSCPVGSGIIPIKECIEMLKDINYDGFLTVEHFGAIDQLKYIIESSDWIDTQIKF